MHQLFIMMKHLLIVVIIIVANKKQPKYRGKNLKCTSEGCLKTEKLLWVEYSKFLYMLISEFYDRYSDSYFPSSSYMSAITLAVSGLLRALARS